MPLRLQSLQMPPAASGLCCPADGRGQHLGALGLGVEHVGRREGVLLLPETLWRLLSVPAILPSWDSVSMWQAWADREMFSSFLELPPRRRVLCKPKCSYSASNENLPTFCCPEMILQIKDKGEERSQSGRISSCIWIPRSLAGAF